MYDCRIIYSIFISQESARNEINRLNTSKNELPKILRGFRIFEYALCQKTKTRKYRKPTERFLNQKEPGVNALLLLEKC